METGITITPNAKAWGTAAPIDYTGAGAGNAYNPQVALDGSGNAIAVWYQYNGTRNVIYTNRYQ